MGFSKLVKEFAAKRRASLERSLKVREYMGKEEPAEQKEKRMSTKSKSKIPQPRRVTVRFSKDVLVQCYDATGDEGKVERRWIERVDENEYVREAKFFKKIAKWAARTQLADEVYENDDIDMFLSKKRADSAVEQGLYTFVDLVKKCGKYVNRNMYAPSSEELVNPIMKAQTEEILTSLVADCLSEMFHYQVEDPVERDALYHDCYHLSRSISWRRQAFIEKNLVSQNSAESESPCTVATPVLAH